MASEVFEMRTKFNLNIKRETGEMRNMRITKKGIRLTGGGDRNLQPERTMKHRIEQIRIDKILLYLLLYKKMLCFYSVLHMNTNRIKTLSFSTHRYRQKEYK